MPIINLASFLYAISKSSLPIVPELPVISIILSFIKFEIFLISKSLGFLANNSKIDIFFNCLEIGLFCKISFTGGNTLISLTLFLYLL